MKKLITILLLAVLAFSVFAQAATEASNEPITIEFWTHEDANRQALEEQYIADFEATHPNVKINITTFCRRFFNQQFKRSCLPDGPKVGSISLSPRGDWRMPSDASSALWLKECEGLG